MGLRPCEWTSSCPQMGSPWPVWLQEFPYHLHSSPHLLALLRDDVTFLPRHSRPQISQQKWSHVVWQFLPHPAASSACTVMQPCQKRSLSGSLHFAGFLIPFQELTEWFRTHLCLNGQKMRLLKSSFTKIVARLNQHCAALHAHTRGYWKSETDRKSIMHLTPSGRLVWHGVKLYVTLDMLLRRMSKIRAMPRAKSQEEESTCPPLLFGHVYSHTELFRSWNRCCGEELTPSILKSWTELGLSPHGLY